MHQVFLGLGSNLGNRKKALFDAQKSIKKEIGEILNTSAIIETSAWGNTNQPDYLNQAIEIRTTLLPLSLLQKVLEIEGNLGRIRSEKWASRTIDIDILYFNNWFFRTPELCVPHPFIRERKFVLEPLAEIAPDFIHPVYKENNLTLLRNLNT